MQITRDLLQRHLARKNPADPILPVPHVTCADGTRLSVQASETSYSSPRDNIGPWTEVEVWQVSGASTGSIAEFEYDAEEPSAYVEIDSVVEFIDNHGGFA